MDFNDFIDEVNATKTSEEKIELVVKGIKRIILGFFKIYFLGYYTSLFSFYNVGEEFLLNSPWSTVLLTIYAMSINLYLNFSGYCDLAIGCSNLFGFQVIENFNWPYLARNMQDLWKRWHISLALWLKKYLFLPLCKFLYSLEYFNNFNIIKPAIAVFITFFAMGLWHGLEFNFILYGFFQGMGLVVVQQWELFLKKLNIYDGYMNLKIINIISIFITFNYFAFCLLLFFCTSKEKHSLLYKVVTRFL